MSRLRKHSMTLRKSKHCGSVLVVRNFLLVLASLVCLTIVVRLFTPDSSWRRSVENDSLLIETTNVDPVYRTGFIRRDGKLRPVQLLDLRDVRPRPSLHHEDTKPHTVLLEPWEREDSAGLSPRLVPAMGRSEKERDDEVLLSRLSRSDPTLGKERPVYEYERPYLEQCKPMMDWQTTFYPTCNLLHELDLVTSSNASSIDLLTVRGSWRMVWKVPHGKHMEDNLVLKMLHMDRGYNEESYGLHIVDAVAMERLTSSPYVVNGYGFCGESVLTEWAQDARTLIKNNTLSNKDRVQVARDLARGLDAIHSLDYKNGRNATLAHNDINIANVVWSGGKVKYNDFNLGVLMKWNVTKPCGFPVLFEGSLWRSPEETRNETYVSEKGDVYSLGNILYQVLTKHQPWTHYELPGRPNVTNLTALGLFKSAGNLPTIPAKYADKHDSVFTQALVYATRSCLHHDPTKRPTASKLAKSLDTVLKLKGTRDKLDDNKTLARLFLKT